MITRKVPKYEELVDLAQNEENFELKKMFQAIVLTCELKNVKKVAKKIKKDRFLIEKWIRLFNQGGIIRLRAYFWSEKANNLRNDKKFEEAYKIFEKALSFESNIDVYTYLFHGYTCYHLKKYDRAIYCFEKFYENNNNVELDVLIYLAESYRKLKKYEKTMKYFKIALRLWPDYPGLRNYVSEYKNYRINKESKRNVRINKKFGIDECLSEIEILIKEKCYREAKTKLNVVENIASKNNLPALIDEIRKKKELITELMEINKFFEIIQNSIDHENIIEASNYLKKIKKNVLKVKNKQIIDKFENYSKIVIRRTILDLGTRFNRLQTSEISEECRLDEGLVANVIKEMIRNNEIYAKYFESTKSIAFDQQANIDEIDDLMKKFEEWEKESKEKKI